MGINISIGKENRATIPRGIKLVQDEKYATINAKNQHF